MAEISWVDLEGVANMRDVGGIPTADGRVVQRDRLLRSDNLQDLTEGDLARLADVGVTDVVDLRTDHEVESEGPGPLQGTGRVAHHHHTLFKDRPEESAVDDALGLAWEDQEQQARYEHSVADSGVSYWTAHYLGYLTDRPDSVIASLRVVAGAEGATIVHCAAGKDRTGTVVGLALAAVGVSNEHVVADYAATSQRLERIVERLKASETYRANLEKRGIEEQMPHPEHLAAALAQIDETWGGVVPWLRENGWTDEDQAALEAKLLGGSTGDQRA